MFRGCCFGSGPKGGDGKSEDNSCGADDGNKGVVDGSTKDSIELATPEATGYADSIRTPEEKGRGVLPGVTGKKEDVESPAGGGGRAEKHRLTHIFVCLTQEFR